MTTKLEPDFIEFIHDVLVAAFLPFDERVNPAEYRSRASIEASAGRPFQTAFGEELFPTISEKAAALFHSLVCNHCFINGNKRTAVIALDLFLVINGHPLAMATEDVYEMAKATATANQEGRSTEAVILELTERITRCVVDIRNFNEDEVKERLGEGYENLRGNSLRQLAWGLKILEHGLEELGPT